MTDMKRVTVAFPDEIDTAILNLKETELFHKCSYSEIVRRLVRHGLALSSAEAAPPPGPQAGSGMQDSA